MICVSGRNKLEIDDWLPFCCYREGYFFVPHICQSGERTYDKGDVHRPSLGMNVVCQHLLPYRPRVSLDPICEDRYRYLVRSVRPPTSKQQCFRVNHPVGPNNFDIFTANVLPNSSTSHLKAQSFFESQIDIREFSLPFMQR